MTRSIEDRLSEFPEAWMPEKGDTLIGKITGLDVRESDYDNGPYPIVTVENEADGKEWAFHAFHTVPKRELAKLRPRLGERIAIAFHGDSSRAKTGQSPTKLYRVIMPDRSSDDVNWSSFDDDGMNGDVPITAPPGGTSPPPTVPDDDDIPF